MNTFMNTKFIFLFILLVECWTYVSKFDWDYAKYPIKQPLKSIAEIISKQVSQIENDLKSKSTQYNAIKQSLQQLQKKQRYVLKL
jgi:V-type H+-transporting ATPase subunit C